MPTGVHTCGRTDEFLESADSKNGMSSVAEGRERMTSVILKLSVSLDGYIAPADGSSDWEAAGRSPDGAAWVLTP